MGKWKLRPWNWMNEDEKRERSMKRKKERKWMRGGFGYLYVWEL
jgi:hypothetical protein